MKLVFIILSIVITSSSQALTHEQLMAQRSQEDADIKAQKIADKNEKNFCKGKRAWFKQNGESKLQEMTEEEFRKMFHKLWLCRARGK